MSDEEPITLKEVQLRLGVPQHVLIHLCEKGVIEPDFAETSGRGKRREFSQRNLFEFAVALALRKFELPVATAALVVRVLRSFARALGKSIPGLTLLDALLDKNLELALHIFDGETLILAGHGFGSGKPVLLSAKIGGAAFDSATTSRVTRIEALLTEYEAQLEVKLSEIAQKTHKNTLKS